VQLRSLFLWDVAPHLDNSTFKAETAMFSGNAGHNHAVMWHEIPEELRSHEKMYSFSFLSLSTMKFKFLPVF